VNEVDGRIGQAGESNGNKAESSATKRRTPKHGVGDAHDKPNVEPNQIAQQHLPAALIQRLSLEHGPIP
jgi:hypothetical protein